MFARNGFFASKAIFFLLVLAGIGLGQDAQSEEPGRAQVLTESAGQIDYWIISTRECPQSFGDLCTPECFEYFHRLPDGSCVPSGWTEFLEAVDPSGPACFLVHGNLVGFEEAISQGWEVVEALSSHLPAGMPVTFVSFTWPSDEVVPLLITADLQIKASRSDATAYYLASLINFLPPNQKVSLLGFSHGARSVVGTLELLGGGEVRGRRLPHGPAPPRPMRASLIAAAMDHHWLRPGERNGRAICQLEALQVFFNCTDWVLRYYPLRCPFSRHALGYTGLDERDWQALGEHASKVQEVDAAELVETMHHWSYYIKSSGFASLLVPYIFF